VHFPQPAPGTAANEIDVSRKIRLPCIATQCIKQESREEWRRRRS
jgi:hypothetical protein